MKNMNPIQLELCYVTQVNKTNQPDHIYAFYARISIMEKKRGKYYKRAYITHYNETNQVQKNLWLKVTAVS